MLHRQWVSEALDFARMVIYVIICIQIFLCAVVALCKFCCVTGFSYCKICIWRVYGAKFCYCVTSSTHQECMCVCQVCVGLLVSESCHRMVLGQCVCVFMGYFQHVSGNFLVLPGWQCDCREVGRDVFSSPDLSVPSRKYFITVQGLGHM